MVMFAFNLTLYNLCSVNRMTPHLLLARMKPWSRFNIDCRCLHATD